MYVPIKCPILSAHNMFCISCGSSQWTEIILQHNINRFIFDVILTVHRR